MKKRFTVAMFGQKRLTREGGVEIVVKELCTRMAQRGYQITCYNRSGHHVSGAEFDSNEKTEYPGIRQKSVLTIEKKDLAAVSSSFFAALYSALGKYDVVHIHAEGPAFFSWIPKLFGKRVVVTIHGLDWSREKWKSGFGSRRKRFCTAPSSDISTMKLRWRSKTSPPSSSSSTPWKSGRMTRSSKIP